MAAQYLTVEEPQYQDRVYRMTATHHIESHTDQLEVVVTDGGNTLEDLNGNIIGHYVGTY